MWQVMKKRDLIRKNMVESVTNERNILAMANNPFVVSLHPQAPLAPAGLASHVPWHALVATMGLLWHALVWHALVWHALVATMGLFQTKPGRAGQRLDVGGGSGLHKHRLRETGPGKQHKWPAMPAGSSTATAS